MKQSSINTFTNYPPRGSKLKEELKHQRKKKVKALHETITIKFQNHHPREQKKKSVLQNQANIIQPPRKQKQNLEQKSMPTIN